MNKIRDLNILIDYGNHDLIRAYLSYHPLNICEAKTVRHLTKNNKKILKILDENMKFDETVYKMKYKMHGKSGKKAWKIAISSHDHTYMQWLYYYDKVKI